MDWEVGVSFVKKSVESFHATYCILASTKISRNGNGRYNFFPIKFYVHSAQLRHSIMAGFVLSTFHLNICPVDKIQYVHIQFRVLINISVHWVGKRNIYLLPPILMSWLDHIYRSLWQRFSFQSWRCSIKYFKRRLLFNL